VLTPVFLGGAIGRACSFLFNKIISPVFPGPITIDPKSPIPVPKQERPMLQLLPHSEDHWVVQIREEGNSLGPRIVKRVHGILATKVLESIFLNLFDVEISPPDIFDSKETILVGKNLDSFHASKEGRNQAKPPDLRGHSPAGNWIVVLIEDSPDKTDLPIFAKNSRTNCNSFVQPRCSISSTRSAGKGKKNKKTA